MAFSVHIVETEKPVYKVVFSDPLLEPVEVSDEEDIKQVIQRLKGEGKVELAKELAQRWVNIHKNSFKLNHKGRFLNIGQKTAVMGILNITPNSFSDGGEYYGDIDKAVKRAEEMLSEGANIIDVGGESTRPGAEPVDKEEEIRRVVPVIQAVRKQLGDSFLISVDTYKSEVAKASLDVGADIVNDISGMTFDPKMADVVAEYDCLIVVNHTRGRPQTMQKNVYYNDVVWEVIQFLDKQIEYGVSKGIKRDRFIVDPGIGFGKYVEHNVEIIKRLKEFKVLGLPIMVGISRKSFIGAILKNLAKRGETDPKDRVAGSLGATGIAVLNGAGIVRTHDVKETVDFLTVMDTIRGYRLV